MNQARRSELGGRSGIAKPSEDSMARKTSGTVVVLGLLAIIAGAWLASENEPQASLGDERGEARRSLCDYA